MLGYLGAYVEFLNERDHGSNYSEWENEWLGIPALPGKLIARHFFGYDYQLTEAWLLDKHRIAFWNGVVFMPLGLLAGMRRRTSR